MSNELSATVISIDGSALELPKLRRLLEESERLIHHGNLKEWQGLLMKAGALWNIKTHKAYLASDASDTRSFAEYADCTGFSERSRQRYVQIGQAMFLFSRERLGQEIDPTDFTFTAKSIADAFEGFFTNGHVVTVAGLAKAALSLDAFRHYLEGSGTIDEKDATKLLLESNIVSEKTEEKKAAREMTDADRMKDFHEARKKEAAEHGLRWDKKSFKFVNLDGSDLREEQIAELTMPEDAFRAWKGFYKEIAAVKKRIVTAVAQDAKAYELYDQHIVNTRFDLHVKEIAKDIRFQVTMLEDMLECMLAKDFQRMETLATMKPEHDETEVTTEEA